MISSDEFANNIIKGTSSHEINLRFPNTLEPFCWQEGFGVLTFGAKNLDQIIDYICRQKEHHTHDDLEPYLERMD